MQNILEYIIRLPQFLLLNRISSTSLRDSSLSLSLVLSAEPSSVPRVWLSRLRATVLPAFRHRGIKIGCHYSLTQFFFNLPRSSRGMRHTYLLIYVCVYTHPPSFKTTSHTSSFVVQFLRRVFAAFSPARLHPPARPKRIRFLGTKRISRHSCEFQFIRARFASSA